MILSKMIINTQTGDIENIPLTEEEIALHQSQQLTDEAAAE
jgi:hypothetical protein